MTTRADLNALQPPDLNLRDVPGLRKLVIDALREAHKNLSDAQAVSLQSGHGVYAQIWRSMSTSLAAALAERYDVQHVKLRYAPYKVPVIGDYLFFAWRPSGGSEPIEVPFGTSDTRLRLWQQPIGQGVLDLQADEDTTQPPEGASGIDDSDSAREVFEAADQRKLRVVIIAMTSDAKQLRFIEWGEVVLADDLTLDWLSHDTLLSVDSSSVPASVSRNGFDDGTPPPSGVSRKPNKTSGTDPDE